MRSRKSRFKILFYFVLILAAIGALYFKMNTGEIFARIGDYYYTKNDITKAQEFYEKSFRLGYNDADLREVYVNSIINSPLTLSSQEKLVKIAEGKTVDGASVKAKYFLYDLKREIHRKYPLNYIKQAPYNQKIVRWSRLPITYAFRNTAGVPDEYPQEIRNAFLMWEKSSPVMFSEVDDLNADITIDFQSNKAEDIDYGKKYVVAYTTPKINLNTLENMNIKFYIQDPEGNKFSRNQIYNTALHEIFHALGFMGHSYDSGNIMYLSKNNKTLVDDSRQELTEADIMTLKLLYKIKPDITNLGDLKSEYLPYLVLGDDDEVNSSKAKEAKHYIHQAPTLPGGYIDLAESLVSQKKYAQAVRALEKALSLADTDDIRYIVYYNLAVSYYYINHIEMAIDYALQAQKIKDPEELHFLLAEIYRKSDIKKACEEYKYLTAVSPDNIDYALALTNIYIKQHDYLKARKVLKTYLKNNPSQKNNPKFSNYKLLIF